MVFPDFIALLSGLQSHVGGNRNIPRILSMSFFVEAKFVLLLDFLALLSALVYPFEENTIVAKI